jgi:plastocyanin
MTMRLLAVLTMVAGTLSLHSAEAVSADSAKVVTVEVGSFYFEDGSTGSQSLVSANVGDQLRFVFVDSGHSADVDALGISTGTRNGGDVFVTAPISQAGDFDLYCKPHRNRGHRTVLRVSNTQPPTSTTTLPPSTTTTQPSSTTTTQPSPTTTTQPAIPSTTTTQPAIPSTTTTQPAIPSTTTTQPAIPSTTTTQPAIPSTTAEPSNPDGNATPSPDERTPTTELSGTAAAFSDSDLQRSEAGSEPSAPLPVGLIVSESNVWIQSVWAGVMAGIPILGAAFVATRRGTSRGRTDG